jgi:RNA ligase (TIGR02306 family)
MDRKLASVQQIAELYPINGADRIEVALIKSWKVVVKKGEFKKGDLCVYFEIDSFLPIREEFEFLRASSYKKFDDGEEGFRLRTVKLRGQISQGLALPLDVIPICLLKENWEVGTDLTELLGVKKYEPPIPASLASEAKGLFPTHIIPKTDGERIQNLTSEYKDYKKYKWRVTEKLDGTSATFYLYNGEFGVCSRNYELLDKPGNTYWEIARKYDIENILKRINKNVAIQGEIIGEGIQGNPYKIKGHELRVYWMYDIDNQSIVLIKLPGETLYGAGLSNLKSVPVIDDKFKLLSSTSIDELLELAENKSNLNSNTEREGLFFNCIENPNLKFKVISNKFLLKQKD